MNERDMESESGESGAPNKVARKISGSNRPAGSNDGGNQDRQDVILLDNDRPRAGDDSSVDLKDSRNARSGSRVSVRPSEGINLPGSKKKEKFGKFA